MRSPDDASTLPVKPSSPRIFMRSVSSPTDEIRCPVYNKSHNLIRKRQEYSVEKSGWLSITKDVLTIAKDALTLGVFLAVLLVLYQPIREVVGARWEITEFSLFGFRAQRLAAEADTGD